MESDFIADREIDRISGLGFGQHPMAALQMSRFIPRPNPMSEIDATAVQAIIASPEGSRMSETGKSSRMVRMDRLIFVAVAAVTILWVFMFLFTFSDQGRAL